MKKILNEVFDWGLILFFTSIIIYGVGMLIGLF